MECTLIRDVWRQIPGRPGQYLPDARSREYLPGMDSARFAAHEQFVLDEVLPRAERVYGAPHMASQRVLFGFSNGATFAAAIALTHPDAFGAVIALSPGGGANSFAAIPQRDGGAPRLYTSGGLYEAGFRANAIALVDVFRSRGALTVRREPAGGHDEAVWQAYFPEAAMWAFSTNR
ncbi:MAG: alpha/beta hydrolase-fold protein [bacterium]